MKKMLLFTLMACMLTTVGCISIHNNKAASDNMPVARACPAAYQAETELGEISSASATVTGNTLFGIIHWGLPSSFADNGSFGGAEGPLPVKIGGDSFGKFKMAAVYSACETNNCDSLMDARYVITTKDYFVYKKVICKVVGTPVKITGYKLIEDKKCGDK